MDASTAAPRTPSRPRPVVVVALLVVAVVAAFSPVLSADFVRWDDDENFLSNPHYRGLGLPQLTWMFTSFNLGHYTPVAWLTFGADYVVWQMNPFGYHLGSLLLHVLNTLLVYRLARRLLEPGAPRAGLEPGLTLGAALAALVFALHPLRVESVAWVTERRGVLAALFCLLSVLAYLRDQDAVVPRAGRPWYWASVGLFGLALLSKGAATALPAALLVLDVYPLRRLEWSLGSWTRERGRAAWLEKVPFVALAAVVAVVAVLGARARMLGLSEHSSLSVLERLALLHENLAFYLWKTLTPTALSPLYELKLPVSILAWPALVSVGLILAITGALIVRRGRWPAVLGAWLVFVAFVAPVSGLFQVGPQAAADRYTYLSCISLALLAGAGVAGYAWSGWSRPRPALVAAFVVLVVVALGVASWRQAHVWLDSDALWTRVIELDPESSVAAHKLGLLDAERRAAALAAGDRTPTPNAGALLAMRARDATTDAAARYFTLAVALHQRGDLDGAMTYYRKVLAYDPRFDEAWNNVGGVYVARGELPAALRAFEHALEINPASRGACENGRRVAAALEVRAPSFERCVLTAGPR
jgi:tetratricopeptide (TPR) repeat protein